MKNYVNRYISLFSPLYLLLIWHFASIGGDYRHFLLPPPLDTFQHFFALVITGDLMPDMIFTLNRWMNGFVMGCLVGAPIGLMMGSSVLFYKLFEFPVEFLRSLPVTALFPLFLLTFGIGDESKIAMAFTSTVFVVIVNSAYGVLHATEKRRTMAKSFGASPVQIFWSITVPESLPQMIVGMRTSLSLSLIVVVVSEMFIGTKYGLGQRIFDAYAKNDVIELYALILFLGIFGFISNRAFLYFEKKILYWVGR